jgi:hypothetical protein
MESYLTASTRTAFYALKSGPKDSADSADAQKALI